MRISLVRSSFPLHKEMVWCGLHKHFPSNKIGLTSGKFQTAAMEPSRMVLMFVSGGTIVLSWLATLAIPFLNLFLCSYSGLEWYMKFLLNVSPAVSTTSTFLIISATSILAACNRWIDTQRSSTYCNSRSIVSVLLMAKLAFLFSGFTWASASQLLFNLLDQDWNIYIFLIARISLATDMLLLTLIGATLRVISIWSGQQHNGQDEQLRRRWKRLMIVFTLTLVASWILVSGLQVNLFSSRIILTINRLDLGLYQSHTTSTSTTSWMIDPFI